MRVKLQTKQSQLLTGPLRRSALRAVIKPQRDVSVQLGQVPGFDLEARQVIIASLLEPW